jgi:cation:H+ antiporter
MSETVIGLTVVAIGTSMPEFVASLVAALRGHNDVALGNVIGSNIYSLLGIGGGTALIRPTNVPPEIITFDNPVMVGASVVLLIFAATGLRLGRIEGLIMLAGYAAYIYLLIPK